MFQVVAANDGGGAKGIMQAVWYSHIESKLKAKMVDVVDLWVGTSVGSITSGVMASGKISADDFFTIMDNELHSCFKRRFRMPFFQAKYSKKPLRRILKNILGNMKLGDVEKNLVITAASLVDGRNHFFKSYDEQDAEMNLVDAITYSWSAPVFFGSSVDFKNKQVWIDGGTGSMNSPIDEALVEALQLDFLAEDSKNSLHLLSLGCGHKKVNNQVFKKARKDKNFSQVMTFLDPANGGLARVQLEDNKIALLTALSNRFDNFSFNRVEPILPKKLDKIDKVKFKNRYVRIATEFNKDINLKPLRKKLERR